MITKQFEKETGLKMCDQCLRLLVRDEDFHIKDSKYGSRYKTCKWCRQVEKDLKKFYKLMEELFSD